MGKSFVKIYFSNVVLSNTVTKWTILAIGERRLYSEPD